MSDQISPPKNVHEAIINVMREVGYVQKSRTPGLNYSFAGEAALIAAIRPYMIENGLYMAVVDYRQTVRDSYTTKNGSLMNSTFVFGIVRFSHAPSGTFVDVAAVGEGADTGDKSANKASTGMYKYALRQTFCIETGDDPDTTPSETQERKPAEASKTAQNASNNPQVSKPAENAKTPEKNPAGSPPASAAKPAETTDFTHTPETLTRFARIVADAAAVGIKVDINPAKMNGAALKTAAESLKKQTAARAKK